jgi:hypothetical protein
METYLESLAQQTRIKNALQDYPSNCWTLNRSRMIEPWGKHNVDTSKPYLTGYQKGLVQRYDPLKVLRNSFDNHSQKPFVWSQTRKVQQLLDEFFNSEDLRNHLQPAIGKEI